MALNALGNYYAKLPDENSGSGTGGPFASSNDVIDSYDDPNGNVTPNNTTKPAFYYKDGDPSVLFSWSVANQNWVAQIN